MKNKGEKNGNENRWPSPSRATAVGYTGGKKFRRSEKPKASPRNINTVVEALSVAPVRSWKSEIFSRSMPQENAGELVA